MWYPLSLGVCGIFLRINRAWDIGDHTQGW